MGKYYCDYCDIYLTHDSMNARKAHNTGRNHISNVRDYFASLGHDTAQSIIDQIIQSHENGGRAAMMAAPSMRLGAGFMNPMAPGMPSFNQPPPFNPPQQVPQYRPPFPPSSGPGGPGGPGMGMSGMPPRPGMGMPPGVGGVGAGGPAPFMPPFAPNAPPAALPPFAPSLNNANGPPTGMPPIGFRPPPAAGGAGPVRPGIGAGGAGGGGGGIHPDRMRMMGA